MWEVWYSREAANYLADNGSLVAYLFFAMESLAETAGWPQNGDYYQESDLVTWQILGHSVIYQRIEDDQIAQITFIKPN